MNIQILVTDGINQERAEMSVSEAKLEEYQKDKVVMLIEFLIHKLTAQPSSAGRAEDGSSVLQDKKYTLSVVGEPDCESCQ